MSRLSAYPQHCITPNPKGATRTEPGLALHAIPAEQLAPYTAPDPEDVRKAREATEANKARLNACSPVRPHPSNDHGEL